MKDGPGGLRDYNVAYWLALVSAMGKQHAWPDQNTVVRTVTTEEARRRDRISHVCPLLSSFSSLARR